MKAIRFSIVALAISGISLSTYAQTADEVLQKHIDAVGGKANWDKVKSVKLTGSMSGGGMEATVVKTFVTDKGMRTDINFGGQDGFFIFTPTGGWTYLPFGGQTKPQALPAEAMGAAKNEMSLKSEQLADKSSISKVTLDGKDTINNVSCYRLKVTDKDGNNMVCYIDSKTYYMVRSESKVKMGTEETEVTKDFSDFKKQKEGIVVPMTQSAAQGSVTFKSIEINKPVADNIFKPDTK